MPCEGQLRAKGKKIKPSHTYASESKKNSCSKVLINPFLQLMLPCKITSGRHWAPHLCTVTSKRFGLWTPSPKRFKSVSSDRPHQKMLFSLLPSTLSHTLSSAYLDISNRKFLGYAYRFLYHHFMPFQFCM